MKPLPRRHTAIAAGAVIMLMIAAACQKDLDRGPNYLKTHFKVLFDWTDARDASPSVMKFIAFPDNGGQMVEYGFTRATGGELDLAAGEYHAVSFNDDTETLAGTGSTWGGYEIYAHETTLALFSPMFSASRAVPRAAGTDGDPVVEEPDMLWTGTSKEGFVSGDDENETLTLRMQPSVYTYTFQVNDVHNLQYVTDITATVSGMSPSMYPSTNLPSEKHCIIPMHVDSDGKSVIKASVRSFGHCSGHEGKHGEVTGHESHMLVVYARLMDGTKWYYEFDVTDILHDDDNVITKPDGSVEVPVVVDELPFPKPFTNGSGMHPDVEDWNAVEVDVQM